MIFLDNASTTKLSDKALAEFVRISRDFPYNPSAQYSLGIEAHQIIDSAKENILNLLGGEGSIIFTGSATESNNQALNSFASKNGKMLISAGEHPSVYNVAKGLQQKGYNVEFIKLDSSTGQIDKNDFIEKMTAEVNFVSIMHVSNETGAINDIRSLVEIAKYVNPKVVFHSDGVQAFGKIPVDLQDLGVDLYTVSAHKINGPKGVGALFVRRGLTIKPFVVGGGQELGLRSGTENTAGIGAFAVSAQEKVSNIAVNFKKVESLQNVLKKNAMLMFPEFRVNGGGSPYIMSCSFGKIRGETLLHALESKGIYIGNGSACSSKKADNRVLSEMGLSQSEREKSVRISFSSENTIEDIEMLLKEIKNILR